MGKIQFSIISFVVLYAVCVLGRALMLSQKNKLPFVEAMKTKDTQVTALLMAFFMTLIKYFI